MTDNGDVRRWLPFGAPMQAGMVGESRAADELNLHLGMMLELFRLRAGLSQHDLAVAVEASAEEIADYERGLIRIPPVRLLELARVLRAPLSAFFHDL